tara:strand:+ start:50 stop:292 length:243 start_codon:yes stop_codon:yes gene_type:complete
MSLEITEKDLLFGSAQILTQVIIHFLVIFLVIDTGTTHLVIILILGHVLSDEETIHHGEEEMFQVGGEDHGADLFLFFGK